MPTFLTSKNGIIAVIVFFVLLLCGFIMKRLAFNVKIELNKYEKLRGPIEEAPKPPPPELLLPGYSMLTKEDYDEIRAKVIAEYNAKKHESHRNIRQ